MSRVSVVIPTFDREATILRAVESALAQGDVVDAVIVVDDGSTDRTAEILATCSDPRLRVIRLAARSGACVARNAGIEASSADAVAFLDADDEWLPGYVESQLAALGGAPAVVSELIVSDDQGNERRPPCRLGDRALERMLLDTHGTFSSSCIVLSRRALDAGVRFDPTFPALQDLDLLLQTARAGRIPVNPARLVVKHTGTTGRVFSGRNIPVGRRRLMTKWAAELERVPGARGRQARKLAVSALRWGDGDDVTDALSRLTARDTWADRVANPAIRGTARLHPTLGAAAARLATLVDRFGAAHDR